MYIYTQKLAKDSSVVYRSARKLSCEPIIDEFVCEIQSSFMDVDYIEIVFPEKNLKKKLLEVELHILLVTFCLHYFQKK